MRKSSRVRVRMRVRVRVKAKSRVGERVRVRTDYGLWTVDCGGVRREGGGK